MKKNPKKVSFADGRDHFAWKETPSAKPKIIILERFSKKEISLAFFGWKIQDNFLMRNRS